jgi:putative ABC transport system ATP-binding protein
MELLQDVNRRRGTTLVLATHDRALAAVADERLALRDGRRVEEGA